VNRDTRIAIIGAGIGGLCAAASLVKAGFAPTLFEQAPALGDVGAGLSITPNATKGLEYIGLKDVLATQAEEPPLQSIRAFDTGALLLSIDRTDTRARYGAAYYMMHRADVHAHLVRLVHGKADIRLGAALQALKINGAKAELFFSTGPTQSFDLVIGADGVKSIVRAALFGDAPPEFAGHVAWRALAPADAAPPEARQPGSVVWTAPGQSFVHYPIRQGALINLVGLTRTNDWRGEGWSQSAPITDFLALYDGWADPVRQLIRAAAGGTCISWGLFTRPALPRFIEGPVALLGDAAHPMLPFMGQGAAMAIEDGVVLGRCCAAASSVADALARYQAARYERATFIQTESAAGADRIQTKTPAPSADGKTFARSEDALGIFHYDPATVEV
jgi:salicylate hydroxylase